MLLLVNYTYLRALSRQHDDDVVKVRLRSEREGGGRNCPLGVLEHNPISSSDLYGFALTHCFV